MTRSHIPLLFLAALAGSIGVAFGIQPTRSAGPAPSHESAALGPSAAVRTPPAALPSPALPSPTSSMGAAGAGSGVMDSGMTPAPGAGGAGGATLPDLPANYAEAKQQIEAAVAARPKEFGRRMAAAAFYMNANDHRSAVPHLQVATRLTNRVFPWIALGDAATLSGQFVLAGRAYDRAAQIDPGNAFTVRGKAQLLIAQQKFSESEDLLLRWLKRYPDNNHIRCELGTLYLLLNKPRKAIPVLEKAVKSRPELAYQHALLGDAYARDLHVEKGLAEMKEAVRLDSTLADAWGKIGLYHVNLSRYQDAREPLERAISLNPMESQFYAALADSYILDEPDEANFTKGLQLYRQSLRLDPKNEKALEAFGLALMRRARTEDVKEAVGLFKRLLQINPIHMKAHYKLAEAYRALGQTREADAHQAKFLAISAKGRDQIRSSTMAMTFHDSPEAHVKLGREAMARQDYDLAAREFQLALQRNRMLKEARAGLLEVQSKLGRTAGAQVASP
jgi:tetratricopeptide (TPR) repeat protein